MDIMLVYNHLLIEFGSASMLHRLSSTPDYFGLVDISRLLYRLCNCIHDIPSIEQLPQALVSQINSRPHPV